MDSNSIDEAARPRGMAPELIAVVLFALVGIGISIYLTTVHYAGAPLFCTSGGVVNCAAVTTSVYSVVPGTQLPITIPGLVWFVVSGGLAIAAWRAQLRDDATLVRITLIQAIWSAIGLVVVLYLVYAELVLLHEICEWCTTVHILTLLTFLVVLYRLQRLPVEEDSFSE